MPQSASVTAQYLNIYTLLRLLTEMTPVTQLYIATSHLPVKICGSDGKELCWVECKHLGAVLPSGWAIFSNLTIDFNFELSKI